ncbi:small subunit ribosomal protein S6e [Enteropsectra breve]|nr:small subunit ribosomal protein S6e [Enteropsectra breve]
MKLNIAYPTNGSQLMKEMNSKDEQRLYGKKIGDQFDGSLISEELAGCILQIVGGNDYQGVAMVPGKDTIKRYRALLSKGDIGYRCRKNGVRRRKTVRGSIVSNEIQVIALILVQVPEDKTIEGLTDVIREKTHLPKKDKKLREMFGIPAGEDIIAFITNLVKENDPEATVPKIKITGIRKESEKIKRAEKKAVREARKEKYLLEKREYESKYGVAL